jgi:hypothetical protein
VLGRSGLGDPPERASTVLRVPTIFGPEWPDLTLVHVQRYLDQADDEPLLWEAKGTKLDKSEIRRQVCAFANSHEGGYLILGADRPAATNDDPEPRWKLDGVAFPGTEPLPWLTEIITDLTVGVRPRPDFDIAAWAAPKGHVAVVWVAATPTPPCNANGTVYERLPGKTQTVRDPLRLADLYARGDAAHRGAQARADRAAHLVMVDWLGGDAGQFRAGWVPPPGREAEEDGDERERRDAAHIRYVVGVAATGNAPNISSRLFRNEFAMGVLQDLRDEPTGLPPGFGSDPDAPTWAQESLTFRHQTIGPVNAITVVCATWDGAAASGVKRLTEDINTDWLASGGIPSEWRRADDLVRRLGGFGDVYVTVLAAGGRFPRATDDDGYIVMRRGPMLPGVHDEQSASLGRELTRSVGFVAEEP